MFMQLREYHRPRDLSEALTLLARPGVCTRALAGGTALVGPLDRATEVLVDLADLGLRYIRPHGDTLRVGAMTTLADLIDHPVARKLGGGMLVAAAGRSGPPNLRARGTVGAALARPHRAPELAAALLALNAAPLRHGPLITQVDVPVEPVTCGWARVARTPADLPTVAVFAAVRMEGDICRLVRLAAVGLSAQPRRLPLIEADMQGRPLSDFAIAQVAGAVARAADPPDDIRGSAEYRRHLARVLTRRALLMGRDGHAN